MDQRCKKCIKIATAGAIIIGCTLGLKEDQCQHLLRHQHVHQEVYTPPEHLKSVIVIATTAAPIPGETVLYSASDPKREGNTICLFDTTS